MSKRTLKFSDNVVKKGFYTSKQANPLDSVNTNNVVIFYRIKHNDNVFKYFIVYSHDDDNVIRPLCVILPQMSGYIKCFHNGGENMSFKIEDESAYLKCTEIWN